MLDSSGIEAETEAFYKNLFLIQDLYGSGYRMADVGPDENGLVNIQFALTSTFKGDFLFCTACFHFTGRLKKGPKRLSKTQLKFYIANFPIQGVPTSLGYAECNVLMLRKVYERSELRLQNIDPRKGGNFEFRPNKKGEF